jgi:hypothetical protein
MPQFPLTQSEEWHDHNDWYFMQADAYLTAQGQLRADITTWTLAWGLGFTGGCTVVVIDANENIITRWLTWPLGVDAKAIWWKPSRRTDHPEAQIDPAIATQANRIEIWLGHMPKDRWDEIINEVRTKVSDVKKLYQDIMDGL